MEALYVRIPAELKERLRRSAAGRGTSMGEEVARVLSEQLERDVSASMRHRHLKLQHEILQSQTKAVGSFVEHLVVSQDLKVARAQFEQLLRMCMSVFRRRSAKELAEELQRQREITAPVSKPEPIDKTLEAACGVTGHAPKLPQFPVEERRRRKLNAVLMGSPRGTKKRVTDALGWQPARLSQMLSAPSAIGHRVITGEVARKLEGVLKLEERVLDRISESGQASFELESAIANIRAVVRTARRSTAKKGKADKGTAGADGRVRRTESD